MNWPRIIEDGTIYEWDDGQHRWIYVGEILFDGQIADLRPRLPWWRRCRWEWVLVTAVNAVCLLVAAYLLAHILRWVAS